MALRDLTEDIRQRLLMIAAERAQLSERIRFLNQTEEHLRSLMSFEELRARSNQPSLPFLPPAEELSPHERSALTIFLQNALASGQTRSLDELKILAVHNGLHFGEKHPGRVLHYALLGMAQGGTVEMVEKGLWRMKGNLAQ